MENPIRGLGVCAAVVFGALSLAACRTITEELPPCQNYVGFRYDYNMKFADAFSSEVRRIDLYVFDADDRFVACLSDERPAFGEGYRMQFPLPAGHYRLIAWAGLYDRSYEFRNTLEPGVSTPADLAVKMRRATDLTRNQELDDLWHGQAEVNFRDGQSRTEPISLTKNTNRFRIVVQTTGSGDTVAFRPNDLLFAIEDDNGRLNYDNTPLADDSVIYQPYYQETVGLSSTKSDGIDAVVAELNTLRLLESKKPRLRVTHRDGSKLFDIDLLRYLLLTKMEGHDMPAQEYLDRQDEFVLIFFLNRDSSGGYMLASVRVNGWTIRPQEGDL